jgi:hypothetical protein
MKIDRAFLDDILSFNNSTARVNRPNQSEPSHGIDWNSSKLPPAETPFNKHPIQFNLLTY